VYCGDNTKKDITNILQRCGVDTGGHEPVAISFKHENKFSGFIKWVKLFRYRPEQAYGDPVG
jgi:hypothetical protein